MKDNILVSSNKAEHLLKVFRKFQNGGDIALELFQDVENVQPVSESLSFTKGRTISENLDTISTSALNLKDTLAALLAYRHISLEIISRWISLLDRGVGSLNTVMCALARAYGPIPESSSLVEYFLSQHENQLTQQLDNITTDNTNHTCISNSQNLLLAFFRLLSQDRHRFKRYVNPDVVYKILEQSSNAIVKYLSIEILCMCLDASESSRQQMLSIHIKTNEDEDEDRILEGNYDESSTINYKFLALIEAKRLSNFAKLDSIATNFPFKSNFNFVIEPSDLSPLVVSICRILVPRLLDEPNLTKENHESTNINSINNKNNQSPDFVPTDNAVGVLGQLASNIQKNQPTMLYGKAGAGKTFLINELAKRMSYERSIVKIHLGEQTDAKLLLGTYASGEKPGTFQWRSGVLTTAVQQGRWVIIEDIDQAPTEVLSVLLTLLEKRELTIPSRGEVIKAKNGFQLISTIRSDENRLPDLIGLRLWSLVNVSSPSELDLKNILLSRFPILGRLLPKIIGCFNEVVKIYNTSAFITLNKGSHPRVISFRDLMKLCSRCNFMLENEGITSTDGLLSQHIYDQLFAETVDCFGSAITEHSALAPLVNAIGEKLEIPSSRINLYMTKHIPQFINNDSLLKVGRATLRKSSSDKILAGKSSSSSTFARTNHSLRLMEQIVVSIQMVEPILLVGETGTGKTTVVQQVAKMMNKKLTVINVSQQTESGDLLGGYKPVNTKTIAVPLQEIFENLFIASFSKKKNEKFSQILSKCFNKSQWKNVIKLWLEAIRMAKGVLTVHEEDKEQTEAKQEQSQKKRKLQPFEKSVLLEKWVEFENRVKDFEIQSATLDSSSFVFSFVEGSLVKAVRNGEWLLLDEINLASSDTLESIADLLAESIEQRSVLLTERGDVESIIAHPDFRIFGCMNPSTDVGKRDLPLSIRSRFSEVYVHSPDKDIQDLLSIIDQYIGRFTVADEWVGNDIAELYLSAKKLSEENKIVDGANQRPHFSIRTLTRTLIYVCDIVGIYGLRRSLYEAFCMSYLTLLDAKSEAILHEQIFNYMLGRLKNVKSVLNQSPPSPGPNFVQFKHYWMKRGPGEIIPQPHYIITPFVEKNMLNLVRATAGRRFPVLVQGPTSAGKTSMIQYLANITGHKFVRINNHEHTDLQEYLGTYMSDSSGKLVFKEGILVEALRQGHWIVLDELNLAPTDVLEALNRLLDDNRELFIPETQEIIRPHPDFMLFATQNPPGLYGGRKMLSRAFRNRFLELHFDDIPQDELEIILRERCQIAPSYGKKIVEVYRQLSIQRQSTRLFEQKNSFATLRDLFRWAMREAVGYEELAANGFMLLAERVRKSEEKEVVKRTIEKVMKVKLDMDHFYEKLEIEAALPEIIEKNKNDANSIVWTKAMRRLAVLVFTSMKYKEPLLLVGETGCGKTTVCQVIAEFLGRKLVTVNAHQNTETGDILGAQRPVRHRFETQSLLWNNLMSLMKKLEVEVSLEDSKLDDLLKLYDSLKGRIQEEQKENSTLFDQLIYDIEEGRRNSSILFDWNDGPLVKAMKNGDFFLLDEISLADDSVLERLNSVLEPERSLLLAEKGNEDSFVTASESFEFLATMNPGGDYGKKELSPALRNRFTEIWVPSMENFDDVKQIVSSKLSVKVSSQLTSALVEFSKWYGQRYGSGNASSGVISLRDILSWVQFINSIVEKSPEIDSHFALLHGAAMVFIDALGTNNTAYLAENEQRLLDEKLEAVSKLSELAGRDVNLFYLADFKIDIRDEVLSSGGFTIPRKVRKISGEELQFNLEAPTTAINAMRVVRAMQVRKPILLEGSPGVGKTSLVSAIAKATGNNLVRINLSEQTDLVDLFGSDAPAEGGKTGEFVWRDAPFLRAMQRGEWVLLDEMNLASQSVLEGLNACLDHRGSAYIPELDKTFERHPDFVVFAAQNPQYQGGGRKGLPKSFVNRFSVVYVDMLKEKDLNMISQHLFPSVDKALSAKMIKYISRIEHEVSVKKSFGHSGGPWEFNLRDTLRWLDLFSTKGLATNLSPANFLNMIVCQRFRSVDDRKKAQDLYLEVFGEENLEYRDNYYSIGESYIQAGGAIISRKEPIQHTIASHNENNASRKSLQCNFSLLETAIRCINLKLPLILTGPTNSGKTELIRYLAEVVGAKVDEFAMNSDVDSMDILGGYEQVDVRRGIAKVALEVKSILVELVLINLKIEDTVPMVLRLTLQFIKFIERGVAQNTHDFAELLHIQLEKFLSIYKNQELEDLFEESKILQKKLEDLKNNSVTFEWFDGLLVQAVEKGHWLILDNANLCSPSVLDRLNSLLEVNGTLIINECSEADGRPRTVQPHPNFRLFLTVDPKYGELSRAMRNRGIEVYLQSLEDRMSTFDMRQLPNIPQSNTVSELGNPVSGYLSAQRSIERTFALIDDFIDLSTLKCDDLVNTIVGTIPVNDFDLIKLWQRMALSSAEFSITSKNLFELLINKFGEILLNSSAKSKLLEIYEPAKVDMADGIVRSKEAYIKNQRIQTLFNTYLTSLPCSITGSAEPAFFLEAIGGLSDISNLVTKLEQNALGKRLGDLTYIERSAAFQLGRNIKKVPRLNIYNFIVEVRDYVANILKERITRANLSIFQEDVQSSYYESIVKLQLTLKCLFDSSNQQDESKLRVYQDLVRQWCEESVHVDNRVVLQKIVESFGNQLSLSSGFSMAALWENLRRSYPSTSIAWKQAGELFRVATLFDEVSSEQFKDANEAVAGLKNVIISIYSDLLGNDSERSTITPETFQKFCTDLEGGIYKLKDVSNEFIIKRNNIFQNEFKLLANIVQSLEMYDEKYMSVLQNLKQLSGHSTVADCLTCRDTTLFSPYPKILDSLWSITNGSYSSHVHGVFSNEILTSTMLKSQKLSSGPGKYLEQNLDDLTTIAGEIIKSSQPILDDRVNLFSKLLSKWIFEIVNIHLNEPVTICEGGFFNNVTLRSVIEHIRSLVSDDKFLSILDKFFFPALFLIANATETNIGLLGRAWVLFSCGAVQLYVPTTSYDPAITDYIVYERFKRHQDESNKLIDSWKIIRSVISGDEHIQAEQYLTSATSKSIASMKTEKPRVYRPETSIDNLFDEWSAFLTSTIDIGPVEQLLEAAENMENLEKGESLINMFQNNSSQFLLRLEQSYFVYSDLNDILKGFVYGMKLGFDLILNENSRNNSKYAEVSRTWPVDVVNVTSSSKLVDNFRVIKEFSKSFGIDSTIPEKVMMFFIRLCFAHMRSESKEEESDIQSVLQQSLQTLYYRWSLRRMKKEEDESAQGNLYKYSDPTGDLEGDFRELFPDFEEVLDSDTTSNVNSIKTPDVVFEELYSKIGLIYQSSFSSSDGNKDFNLEDIIEEGDKLHTLLYNYTSEFTEESTPGTLSSLLSRISITINSFSASLSESELDFYRGNSQSESKRSISIIKSLQVSSLKLLTQWPEHATLQNISRICDEYLSFPIDTPIARLLQKIEQVYTYIAEWEKYASSHVTLKNHFDNLTQLIVSWRKLELSSWKSLFIHEDSIVKQSLGRWWFYLFETIVIPQLADGVDEDIVVENSEIKLISALNVFISQATYGEYEHRLNLLTAFRNHVFTIANGSTRVHGALSNFITFYEQFTPIIHENIAKQKKALEKDVSEVILLASWKDVNIDALKQSARRSHNNLYKIVRKYRALLATPVSPIIEQGLTNEFKSIPKIKDIDGLPLAKSHNSKTDELVTEVKTWGERPTRLQNIQTVSKNMQVYNGLIRLDVIPSINDYAKDLILDMERLRNETPKELKKDNKKLIATLLTQKRKLLSDTLKELRRIGLKTSLRTDIHKMQETVTKMLCNSKSFEESHLLKGSDVFYFRILDLMPRLRASVSGLAEGVPQSDADRGLAASENLVFSLATTRKPLVQFADSVLNLEESYSAMIKISNSVLSDGGTLVRGSIINSISLNMNKIQLCIHWLRILIDFAIENIKSATQLNSVVVDQEVFYSAKIKINGLSSKIADCNTNTFGATDEFEMAIIQDFREFFYLHFPSALQSWKSVPNHENLSFIADTILEWANSQKYSISVNSETSNSDPDSLKSVEDVELSLRDLSTSIILCVQKVVEEKGEPILESDDNWLVLSQQKVMAYIKALHHRKITSKLNDILNIISSVEHNEKSSKVSAALVAFSMPLVLNYIELTKIILGKVRDNYVELSKGTFVLSSALYVLATKGFCSPEPPSEQKEDNNLHEGTGLGDGEGATNNSKDVEEDEDLTEDAQQPNEENKEKDDGEEDENDDAVDIEGDMAGELEDASDQDKDDDEDEGDDQELDEEIDDIDDLDPNAIDDKMWDEEAQENSKEKDSEKMPDNSNKDDDNMEANEDDNDDSKQNPQEKQPEDGQNQDDNPEEEQDDDEDGEDEKDVGEQEDDVKNEENEQLENNVPETETLDLPEDMNLDSGEEQSGDENEDDDEFDDKMDDKMDIDENGAQDDDNKKEEEEEVDENLDSELDNSNNAEEEDIDLENEKDNTENDENDMNEEEGLSDEETLGDKQEDVEEDKEEGGNDNDAANDQDRAEGVDGANEDAADEEMDAETAVKQESGQQGDGADNQVTEDNKDLGSTGGASSNLQQDMDKNEDQNDNEEARDMARESLKQLGDSLKEFHRRRQEIQESSTREEEDKEDKKGDNERPDEFEHIEGENADFDTQALGAADKEQIQSIDEEKAIDDDLENQDIKKELEDDTIEKELEGTLEQMEVDNEDEEKPEKAQEDGDFDGQAKGSTGDFKKNNKNEDEEEIDLLNLGDAMEIDESDEERIGELNDQYLDLDTPPIDITEARELWKHSELATQELASGLCEQLRLILEPTLATKLRGDYKTGKRLNMKRIIPYIASDFRKDKIWLRRTKPSKRQYQIMIAIDDSKSMSESKSTELAFHSIALVSKALTQLESGGLSIVRFGEDVKVVHPFDRPFNNQESGAKIFQWFDFQQTQTDITLLCKKSLRIFENAKASTSSDLWQLQIILSDGVCEDHETVQRLVRRAREQKIMLVFVVIDGITSNESILDMSQVTYETDSATGASNLKVTKYLDTFPFEFYVIVRNINELPEMLSLILRQYFSEMASA